MPTGYTQGIYDGSYKTFDEFALDCARGFGFCISLRDEPLNGEVPQLEENPYYETRFQEADEELKDWLALTDEELQEKKNYYDGLRQKEYEESLKKTKALRERYDTFLDKAQRFVPPTTEHERHKTFMIEQINQSMAFDCTPGPKPVVQTFEEWKKSHFEYRTKNRHRCLQDLEEHRKRTQEGQKWIAELVEAVKGLN